MRRQLSVAPTVVLENVTRSRRITARHGLSARQVELLLAGGLINHVRATLANVATSAT